MKQCQIKLNPKKGRGVFAAESIKNGEVIEVCELLFIPNTESTLEAYVFRYDRKSNALALGNGSLYNHGKPNAQCYFAKDKIHLVFEAIKDISAGEEILIDYGYTEEMKKRFKIKV